MSKTLLTVCQGYPPYTGGGENAAAYLSIEAAKDPDIKEVHAVTSDIGGRLPAYEEIDGVHIHRISCKKKEWTQHSPLELLDFLNKTTKAIPELHKKINPDYCIAHFSVPAGEIARRWKNKFGLPYTCVMHGSDVPGHRPDKFTLYYPVLKPIVRKVWKAADQLVAVSPRLKNLALETAPDLSINCILNGVDVDQFHPQEKEAGPSFKIMVSAQLIKLKGLADLIESISALNEESRAKVQLNIAGKGPEEAALKSLCAEKKLSGQVHFLGHIEKAEMINALRNADCFILPSYQEGLPLSLLEAAACRLPIIATPVGAISEVFTHQKNALLQEPGDIQTLSSHIQQLISNPALREELGQAARNTAEQYSWKSIWAEYKKILPL